MAKLGYTWYPKDWGNSESVFELNLSERGLYRELIDLAMLNDNKTEIKLEVWSRKFAVSADELKSILGKLSILGLTEVKGDLLFIPSCESRLNLVRGGAKGGGTSKPPKKPTLKPISKPFESLEENNEKPIANQIEKETKSKVNKKEIIYKSLMSEIKISDDKKYFLRKDLKVEAGEFEVRNFEIAERFRKLFIKNLKEKEAPTTNPDNAKFKSYVDPIRLMFEKDGVTIEQMREVVRYLESKDGEFWKSNILSTDKLRDKIATVISKKNEVKKTFNKPIPTN